jgi:hypothetical protein
MATIKCRVVLVMAFPPPDGHVTAGTLECGNAGLQGEHRQKNARNGRSSGFSADQPGVESAAWRWTCASPLAVVDTRTSQVVEMRCFHGLSVEETPEALYVSVDTVMRDGKLARRG